MTTNQAIEYLLRTYGWSKYKLAQRIGCAPVSIDQWLKGTKMGAQYRAIVKRKFGVEVNDETL